MENEKNLITTQVQASSPKAREVIESIRRARAITSSTPIRRDSDPERQSRRLQGEQPEFQRFDNIDIRFRKNVPTEASFLDHLSPIAKPAYQNQVTQIELQNRPLPPVPLNFDGNETVLHEHNDSLNLGASSSKAPGNLIELADTELFPDTIENENRTSVYENSALQNETAAGQLEYQNVQNLYEPIGQQNANGQANNNPEQVHNNPIQIDQNYLQPIMDQLQPPNLVLPLAYQSHLDPGIFVGSQDPLGAEQYLERFEKIAGSCAWTPEQKYLVMSTTMRGMAMDWHRLWENDHPAAQRTWDLFRTDFLRQWRSVDYEENNEYRLRRRYQRPDELPEAYMFDVLNLCNKVDANMNDRTKIRHLMHGFHSNIKSLMTIQNPTTLPEFKLQLERVRKSLRCKEESAPCLSVEGASGGTPLPPLSIAQLDAWMSQLSVLKNQLKPAPPVQPSAPANDVASFVTEAVSKSFEKMQNQLESRMDNLVQQVNNSTSRDNAAQSNRNATNYDTRNNSYRYENRNYPNNSQGQRGGNSNWAPPPDRVLPSGAISCGKCFNIGHGRSTCSLSAEEARESRSRKLRDRKGGPRGSGNAQSNSSQGGNAAPVHYAEPYWNTGTAFRPWLPYSAAPMFGQNSNNSGANFGQNNGQGYSRPNGNGPNVSGN